MSWFFPPTEPYRVQGRGLAEDNFAAEDRNSEEIMAREGYQNGIDARPLGSSAAVRVVLKTLRADQFDVEYLKKLLTPDYLARLSAATDGMRGLDFSNPSILILEDFGTTGLEGNFGDSTVDGNRENWNAFWFREGEGAKSGAASNGRAGQGKVTFYRIGLSRAVLGYTIRHSDRKALLMGRSSFRRNYNFGDIKYERDSFWCKRDGKKVLPIEEGAEIQRFKAAFHLERQDEPGLSLVIPFPVDFEPMELARTAISDFYLPIARGRLEVQIGNAIINSKNVDEKADSLLPDRVARERRSSFTKGFRSMVQGILKDEESEKPWVQLKLGWERSARLNEDFFPAAALDQLRATLEKGDRVSVRCPVTVKPKNKPAVQTWFDIHFEVPDGLEKVEEAYIRRDLLIGSETHLTVSSYLPKARGLTLIEDDAMSAFLADAEEPTHLKWNASRPRLAEDYKSPKELVRAVRQALPRVLTLLSGSDSGRDVKALAKYFTKPADKGKKHEPGGVSKGDDTTPLPDPPEPQRKPLRLVTGPDWVGVRPNGSAAFKATELPILCELEVAYEGLDQNPFAAYDLFDFDLKDTETHSIAARGVTIVELRNNQVDFEIVDPDFDLRVSGFDANIRLRARLTYEEEENGTSLNA